MRKKKLINLYSYSTYMNISQRAKYFIIPKFAFKKYAIFMGIFVFNYLLIYLNLDLLEFNKNETIPYVQEDYTNVNLKCPMVKPENQWSQINESLFKKLRHFKPPLFIKPPIAENLLCSNIFEEKEDYIKDWSLKRLIYKDDEDMIKTDCESIRRRNYFPEFPNSKEEAEFPIAFNRLVYKDYLFLEMELAAEYAPQNYYCYVVDSKATVLFKKRIKNLSSCFPNVYVSENMYNTTSTGDYVNIAYWDCLNILSSYTWNYVVILNNHDVILRTNYEIVQIYKWLCGANDVQMAPPDLKRVNLTFDWTYFGLGLFKNKSKNYASYFDNYDSSVKIRFAQGHAQNSLSRAMVDFMINELDLTKFLFLLEGLYGVDELFIATINADDHLKAPGGFTYECLDRGLSTTDVTRHTFWIADPIPNSICLSKHWRHEICVLGIEDTPRLLSRPEIYINKMMPEIDFAAIVCWHEYMFNRSHLEAPTNKHLNKTHYFSLPHLKYHYKKLLNNGTVDKAKVDCTFNGTLMSIDVNNQKYVRKEDTWFRIIFYIMYVSFCIYVFCGRRIKEFLYKRTRFRNRRALPAPSISSQRSDASYSSLPRFVILSSLLLFNYL